MKNALSGAFLYITVVLIAMTISIKNFDFDMPLRRICDADNLWLFNKTIKKGLLGSP